MLQPRRTRWVLAVATAAALAVTVAAPAHAATLYLDTFQDGNADGWTFTNGAWSVVAEDGASLVLRRAQVDGEPCLGRVRRQ